jgi:hypothetical protein
MKQPRFFPAGDGCAPLDEQIPTPEANEVVVFRNFFPVDSDSFVIRFFLQF